MEGKITAVQIQEMPYVDFLAMMGESNLPPGGFEGIRNLISYNHIHQDSTVLHVGSSAGFLSRELVRLTGCNVVGVDINKNMTESATARANRTGLSEKCKYINEDICRYLSTEKFDVALTGGSLAFVFNQEAAIDAMINNVKPYGFVSICELFYHETPPIELRKKVSEIIGVNVPEYSVDHWENLVNRKNLVIWKKSSDAVRLPSEIEKDLYCKRMTDWVGKDWSLEAKAALFKRITEYIDVFHKNMSYLSCFTVACRKLPEDHEPLLFT